MKYREYCDILRFWKIWSVLVNDGDETYNRQVDFIW